MEREEVKNAGGPADNYAARRHIEYLFGPFIEAGSKGLMCVAHTERQPDGKALWLADLFPLTPAGVDRAIAYATRHSERDDIYIRAGVVRRDYAGNPNAIRDDDIVALNAFWIDCDEDRHFDVIDSEDGAWPRPTFHVITGTKPNLRRQSWWILDTPCQNIDAWRTVSADLQAFMGSDSAVKNPARYMRLAGFLSHPKPDKEGRQLEPVRAVAGSGERVEFEDLAHAFRGAGTARTAEIISDPQLFGRQTSTWDADLGATGRTDEDLIALLEASKRDGQWHNAALHVTASLVGQRYSDLAIHAWFAAFGRADGGIGDDDIQKLITSARQKWDVPPPRYTAAAELETRPSKTIVDFDDIDDVEDPPEIVQGLIIEGGLYGVIAPPKSGKSFAVADLVHAIGAGREWFGRRVAPSSVVYAAAERSYLVTRRYRALKLRRPASETSAVRIVGGYFDLLSSGHDADVICDAMAGIEERSGLPCRVIVIDTLAQTLGGGDDVENMPGFVNAIQRLRDRTKACIIVVHHTAVADGKRARGRSDFTGAVDGIFRVEPQGEEPWTEFKFIAGASNSGTAFEADYSIETQPLGYLDQWGEEATEGVLVPLKSPTARSTPWEIIGLDLSTDDTLNRLDRLYSQRAEEGTPDHMIGRRSDQSDAWIGFDIAHVIGIDLGDRKAKKTSLPSDIAQRRWAMECIIADLISRNILEVREVSYARRGGVVQVVRRGC